MSDDLALAPNEPMVRFQGVTKRYGALTVLDRLDLDVAPNEKVAIIGPSGSGKTTVLRMLMTLERIDGGVIWVEGEPLTHEQQNGQRDCRRRRGSELYHDQARLAGGTLLRALHRRYCDDAARLLVA